MKMVKVLVPVALIGIIALVVYLLPNYSNYLPSDFDRAFSDPSAQAELLSLDPSYAFPGDNSSKQLADTSKLHGSKILGAVTLSADERRKVYGDYRAALGRLARVSPLATACLFEPRQAIRTRSGGHDYEVLVCFHCMQMEAYVDHKQEFSRLLGPGSPEPERAILRAHGIPLASD